MARYQLTYQLVYKQREYVSGDRASPPRGRPSPSNSGRAEILLASADDGLVLGKRGVALPPGVGPRRFAPQHPVEQGLLVPPPGRENLAAELVEGIGDLNNLRHSSRILPEIELIGSNW